MLALAAQATGTFATHATARPASVAEIGHATAGASHAIAAHVGGRATDSSDVHDLLGACLEVGACIALGTGIAILLVRSRATWRRTWSGARAYAATMAPATIAPLASRGLHVRLQVLRL